MPKNIEKVFSPLSAVALVISLTLFGLTSAIASEETPNSPSALDVAKNSPSALEETPNSPLALDVAKIRSLSLPDLSSSSKVHFRYLTYPKNNFDSSKYTLVILPGGPGGASSNGFVEDFPKDVQIVFIDPRGTGVNLELGLQKPELLSSRGTVNDTLAVLKNLQLKNYTIWGTSYGTVTATMLTYEIENSPLGVELPRSTILEGTFHKALKLKGSSLWEGYDLRFRDFYSNLPDSIFAKIKKLRHYQLNKEMLGLCIQFYLGRSNRPLLEKYLEVALRAFLYLIDSGAIS